MLSRPFIGNARANLAAENIEIELEIGAFLIEPRQVDGDGLKIEAAGKIHPANGKTIFLPFGRAAELRKRLSKHGRRDREFARGKTSGFNLISRNRGVAEQDDGGTILNS